MEIISTAGVPAPDRFDFWREISAKLWVSYELRYEPEPASFQAQVGVSAFGALQASLLTTRPHVVARTGKAIRRSDPAVLKFGCVIRGGALVERDGRQAELRVGDLTLFDTSRPFQGRHLPGPEPAKLLLLQFPRALLPLPAREVRELSCVRIAGDHGVGALSSRFLRELARRMDEFSVADAARLAPLTMDLLVTALASALEAADAVPEEAKRHALRARVHVFIREHLGDPDLGPRTIAEAHHISVRYLHKLFQAEVRTVADLIRHTRLERCRLDLADPRLAGRPVRETAARWGFTSNAHFSQTFRAAYGLSPSELRRGVRAD
ncbi:helix-turn-helix domain-containing protein [Amycolatopsis sp. NPDC098790]|uniref:AraC-like ligand-binding domain-containing protein n=1 Tax=Amycolatopsis sp. NPDC098790 TaxID=3363939 RepID=UPI00380A5198